MSSLVYLLVWSPPPHISSDDDDDDVKHAVTSCERLYMLMLRLYMLMLCARMSVCQYSHEID